MTITGTRIKGYGFDEDKDVVWLEGTAQMVVAIKDINRPHLAQNLQVALENSLISSNSVSMAKGLPYATNHGTSYGSGELWYHAHTKPALSASVWYVFATTDFNPLALGNIKEIPEVDKFWALTPINQKRIFHVLLSSQKPPCSIPG